MTRPASCHPDRPHVARKMCRTCYGTWWKRQNREKLNQAAERPCSLCSRPFADANPRRLYCCDLCLRVASDLVRTERPDEELHVLRSETLFRQLLQGYLERGCQRVGNRINRRTSYPYVAAWDRGGGLLIIRARLPEEYREESEAA